MKTKIHSNKSSFIQQFIALIKRNFLIKLRNQTQTLIVFAPLLVVFVACNSLKNVSAVSKPPINDPIGSGSNWFNSRGINYFPDLSYKTWTISPKNDFTDRIIVEIKEIMNYMRYPSTIINSMKFNNSYGSSEEIEKEYLANHKMIPFGIIFDPKLDSSISYTIRMPLYKVPNGDKLKGSPGDCREKPFDENPNYQADRFNMSEKCEALKYYKNGFTFIQTVVDSAIIKINNPAISNPVIPSAKLFIYPKSGYIDEMSYLTALIVLPMAVIMCFWSLSSVFLSNLVLEKEKKIKETMFMMGLRVSAYWLSWISTEAITASVIIVVFVLLVKLFNALRNVNPLIFPILISMYGLNMIAFTLLLTQFFNKEKSATGFANSLLPIFQLAPIVAMFVDFSLQASYLLSLYSPFAVVFGVKSIIERSIKMNMYYGFNQLYVETSFTVGSALIMLFIDTILYALIAIYLDQVIPGEYGSKQKFYFCFDYSFWFSTKPSHAEVAPHEAKAEIEEVPKDMRNKNVINISHISKKYKNQNQLAVNNISLSIYESQITALLGHNGAGKTTLINMLVGSISPTSGTAYIYGYDISNPSEMNDLRSLFGICQQQDILFDKLSAEEHLQFYSEMKGIEKNKILAEVIKLLTEVQLIPNKATPSEKLSGGQKRKLCIAIALIGDPKVILLDEPTSGVDACTRRQIWTLIQSYRKERVIILTTHFMDEADVLSDRKAIISNGKLRCVGSSLFLKNRYGIGYHLTVELKRGSNIENITSLIKTHIQSSTVERFTESEVFYILPQNESNKFSKLFKSLDDYIIDKKNKDIESYGISMTTLEEVFLKLGGESDTENQKTKNAPQVSQINLNIKCKTSFCRIFFAFFYFRILIFIRNPFFVFEVIFSPIIFAFIIYIVGYFASLSSKEPKPLLLNSNIYDKEANNLILKFKADNNVQYQDLVSSINSSGIKTQRINDLSFDSLKNSYLTLNLSDIRGKDIISWQWLFNDTYLHSLPILQNLMTNTFLKLKSNQRNIKPIETYNHPFAYNVEDRDTLTAFLSMSLMFTVIVILIISFYSTTNALSIAIIDERETKFKDMLRVCGISDFCYWLTTLAFHYSIFLFSISIILLVPLLIIRMDFLEPTEAKINLIVFSLLIGVSLFISSYVFTQLFATKVNAVNFMTYLHLIPSFPMMFVVFFVYMYFGFILSLIPHIIFSIVMPSYVLIMGLVIMLMIHNFRENEHRITDLSFAFSLCLICCIINIVLYSWLLSISERLMRGERLAVVLCISSSKPPNICVSQSNLEDSDVKQERIEVKQKLSAEKQNMPILLLNDLRKEYWKSTLCSRSSVELAVNNLSLKVEKNNIFGLLGPNGAGKTSTIKIIIGEEVQTYGNFFLNGQEITSFDSEILQSLGYCPQHDSLCQEMTVREHLYLFATIRGIPSEHIKDVCNSYLNAMQITEHSNKKIDQLSGGTKRKLSYLISLLGEPKLVLLDEPSTGMDPKSKRYLWETTQKIFNANSDKSAILTTHSMEETNALCTRLAIMTKGIMRCIGSVQHLKNKYGAGYVLEIKWNQSNEDINKSKVKQLVSNIFTKSSVKEEFDDRLVYIIPQESVVSLSHIFSSLENAKNSMSGIEEYSFSQTTIEQVFIYFAEKQ